MIKFEEKCLILLGNFFTSHVIEKKSSHCLCHFYYFPTISFSSSTVIFEITDLAVTKLF